MKTLRKLAAQLEQPVWFLGYFENMPEGTFFDRLEKARCYHGHTKVEMATDIGVNKRIIFNWKDKEPSQVFKEKVLLYCKILD
jgi:DNA-binding XRE family transcriptional regulator